MTGRELLRALVTLAALAAVLLALLAWWDEEPDGHGLIPWDANDEVYEAHVERERAIAALAARWRRL